MSGVEIEHGGASRTFCLAISSDEVAEQLGRRAWSGALDQIAAGSMVGDMGDPPQPAQARPKRLMVVATGHSKAGMQAEVEAPCATRSKTRRRAGTR